MLTDCRFWVSVTKWTEFTFQTVGFFLKFVTKTQYIILIKTNQKLFFNKYSQWKCTISSRKRSPNIVVWALPCHGRDLSLITGSNVLLIDEPSPQRVWCSVCEKRAALGAGEFSSLEWFLWKWHWWGWRRVAPPVYRLLWSGALCRDK